MAKRNFAVVVAVLLSAVQLTKPAAAQLLEFDEGCVLLGEVVRQATVSELYAQSGEIPSSQAVPPMDSGGLQACGSTTSVVSSAYAAALAQFGMYVRWSYLPPGNGIACLSHDISTCHPFSDPMGPQLTPPDLAFIGNSWNRMRGGVAAHMPWGTASDMSYFRASALAQSFRPGVSSGPWQPRQGSIGD